jgi:hypothetical protein
VDGLGHGKPRCLPGRTNVGGELGRFRRRALTRDGGAAMANMGELVEAGVVEAMRRTQAQDT